MTHRCCLICDRHETLNCPVDAFGTAWSVSTNYCCHYKEKNRENIHKEALASLVFAGLTKDQGMIVVRAIAAGNIPHCSIQY